MNKCNNDLNNLSKCNETCLCSLAKLVFLILVIVTEFDQKTKRQFIRATDIHSRTGSLLRGSNPAIIDRRSENSHNNECLFAFGLPFLFYSLVPLTDHDIWKCYCIVLSKPLLRGYTVHSKIYVILYYNHTLSQIKLPNLMWVQDFFWSSIFLIFSVALKEI